MEKEYEINMKSNQIKLNQIKSKRLGGCSSIYIMIHETEKKKKKHQVLVKNNNKT